ncbi:hypothetical protein BKA66DRAFT_568126 [Pyrenochaeta sp. MPI-SDFR-AT-0127]|nr:hypothetical protein BKA66DRAFT_568126 [Pyrenochaeta sp. MPI-SDFR-AT-0127]
MSDNNTVALFLVPSATGVRSHRHRVVMRRAEEHLSDLVRFLEQLITGAEPTFGNEQASFILYKADIIRQSLNELDRYVAGHPRTRIIDRLQRAREKLVLIARMLGAT